MAAGKIFNATKKTYRKRKSSGFKKAVQAIAKTTVLRQAETKTGNVNVLGAIGTFGAINPVWQNITQGDAQFQRDGDRIKALGVKLRGYIHTDPSVITTNQDNVFARFVVFSGKRPITTITDSGLTYNNAVDPELLNIHHDSYIQFRLDGRTRMLNKYIKFNRNVLFNPSGGQPSKNELFVAFLPQQSVVSGMTTTAGLYLNYTMQPYFKDL